jgi:hypothetical protein
MFQYIDNLLFPFRVIFFNYFLMKELKSYLYIGLYIMLIIQFYYFQKKHYHTFLNLLNLSFYLVCTVCIYLQ